MVRIPKPVLLKSRLLDFRRRRKKNAWRQDEISRVMDHYDLGSWKVGDRLGGGNSDNVVLQTDQGKKVLKRYYWSIGSVVHEHSILDFLANKKFPCARLLKNKSGLTITYLDKRFYSIYEFIEGYCYLKYYWLPHIKQNFIAQAGEKLAVYHRLVADFVPKGIKLNGFKPCKKKLWRNTAWHLNVINEYLSNIADQSVLDDRTRYLCNIADNLKSEYVEVDRLYGEADQQLPKLVIHSDYKPQNILFDNHGISGILDFGDANLNFRVADIARGLSTFCGSKRSIINQQFAKTFLDSYLSEQRLTQKEIASIPNLLIRGTLRHIIWSMHGEMKSHLNRKSPQKHFDLIRSSWERTLLIKNKTDELKSMLLMISRAKSGTTFYSMKTEQNG
jgi:Ser/Thr protein kinase RdoA (MazF antagonist)